MYGIICENMLIDELQNPKTRVTYDTIMCEISCKNSPNWWVSKTRKSALRQNAVINQKSANWWASKSENPRYAKILWENIYEKSANSWVSKTKNLCNWLLFIV
jgi:hypothetical protein